MCCTDYTTVLYNLKCMQLHNSDNSNIIRARLSVIAAIQCIIILTGEYHIPLDEVDRVQHSIKIINNSIT